MELNNFLRERQPRWQRLSALLDKVDAKKLSGLTTREAEDLFSLYRLVSSDLSLVQTRTANPALVDYLEKLVGRAYANCVVPRRGNLLLSLWHIISRYFPHTLRANYKLLFLSILTMSCGVLFGFVVTLINPAFADVFLPPEHLAESPSERVATLEAAEREGKSQINSAVDNAQFSTFLFTHNIKVSVLCFALGLTYGVGTVALLFFNGAMLGSLAAMYLEDGVIVFFIAWIGPHGSIELPCIMFAGAAGLMLARAQLNRAGGTTFSQIRAIRPALVDLIIGTSVLLVIAGIVEGGFSQVNEPTLPYWFKITVAACLFAGLCAYLGLVKGRPRETAEMPVLAPELEDA